MTGIGFPVPDDQIETIKAVLYVCGSVTTIFCMAWCRMMKVIKGKEGE